MPNIRLDEIYDLMEKEEEEGYSTEIKIKNQKTKKKIPKKFNPNEPEEFQN